MATARAVYNFGEHPSIAVSVEVDGGFPDSVHEARAQTVALLGDAIACVNGVDEDEAEA